MSRTLLAVAGVLFATAGCARQDDDLRAFVAVSGQYAIMQIKSPAPHPEVCQNCGGTGRIGDGKVSWPCPVCQIAEPPKPCKTGTCATRR